MILKFIYSTILNIISFVIGAFSITTPENFFTWIGHFFIMINEVFHMATNFLYFAIGDAVFIIAPFGIALLTFKYLVFPVLVIIRRVFIKGGDQ